MTRASSAGNTRGLIEAAAAETASLGSIGLPRGIPAASLKRGRLRSGSRRLRRLPRGIPAASLKLRVGHYETRPSTASSAGNTRGLIEAGRAVASLRSGRLRSLPRGIPAASLKPRHAPHELPHREGLPRGIPAASLKQDARSSRLRRPCRLPRGIPAASLKRLGGRGGRAVGRVFRGEYPRPH